jgi:hypothetical protein
MHDQAPTRKRTFAFDPGGPPAAAAIVERQPRQQAVSGSVVTGRLVADRLDSSSLPRWVIKGVRS